MVPSATLKCNKGYFFALRSLFLLCLEKTKQWISPRKRGIVGLLGTASHGYQHQHVCYKGRHWRQTQWSLELVEVLDCRCLTAKVWRRPSAECLRLMLQLYLHVACLHCLLMFKIQTINCTFSGCYTFPASGADFQSPQEIFSYNYVWFKGKRSVAL